MLLRSTSLPLRRRGTEKPVFKEKGALFFRWNFTLLKQQIGKNRLFFDCRATSTFTRLAERGRCVHRRSDQSQRFSIKSCVRTSHQNCAMPSMLVVAFFHQTRYRRVQPATKQQLWLFVHDLAKFKLRCVAVFCSAINKTAPWSDFSSLKDARENAYAEATWSSSATYDSRHREGKKSFSAHAHLSVPSKNKPSIYRKNSRLNDQPPEQQTAKQLQKKLHPRLATHHVCHLRSNLSSSWNWHTRKEWWWKRKKEGRRRKTQRGEEGENTRQNRLASTHFVFRKD